MKILFVSSEMSPLAKSGGLGDVVGALPRALREMGHDARVIIPLYRHIKEAYRDELQFMRWSMTKLGWRSMYNGLFRLDLDGLPVYLIDNEFYFGYEQLYVDYSFDIERFSFFQRAVLEVLGEGMDFAPQILHLNDWQTAMIPVLLEAHYKSNGYLKDLQSLLTIHNLKYQGIHGRERVQDLLDLPSHYMDESSVLKDGAPNFLKAGIVYSNRVTTVSPSYAYEMMMDYYGEGLNGILGAQRWKVQGILNGIDQDLYNPETDPVLVANYGIKDWKQGKKTNKVHLQKSLGLPEDEDIPFIAFISRLVDQKGVDLLLYIMDELMEEGVQLMVLGTGDERYEHAFRNAAGRHPDQMRSYIGFDENYAREIYAAADIFLMPSIFEPCGLSQMIAMRYGTLPIVRETGGLNDTVDAYNKYDGSGNGFSFSNINAHELLFTTQHAVRLYRDNPETWDKLVESAMSQDHSWNQSAEQYLNLYRQIIEETGNWQEEEEKAVHKVEENVDLLTEEAEIMLAPKAEVAVQEEKEKALTKTDQEKTVIKTEKKTTEVEKTEQKPREVVKVEKKPIEVVKTEKKSAAKKTPTRKTNTKKASKEIEEKN